MKLVNKRKQFDMQSKATASNKSTLIGTKAYFSTNIVFSQTKIATSKKQYEKMEKKMKGEVAKAVQTRNVKE